MSRQTGGTAFIVFMRKFASLFPAFILKKVSALKWQQILLTFYIPKSFSPFDVKIRVFCFYLSNPKLQQLLSLLKCLIFISFVVRAGCTLYNHLTSVILLHSLCPVLPLDPSSSGWTSLLGSTAQQPSVVPPGGPASRGWTSFDMGVLLESDSGASSSGRSNSNPSVNQPQPGEQAMPPARPANQGPPGVPYPYQEDEMIGGDSIERIQRRLLSQAGFPSAHDIELARIQAADNFEVKVDIIRQMTPLHPEGDWVQSGARALDDPRSKTGEPSYSRLCRLRDDLFQGGSDPPPFWSGIKKQSMVTTFEYRHRITNINTFAAFPLTSKMNDGI